MFTILDCVFVYAFVCVRENHTHITIKVTNVIVHFILGQLHFFNASAAATTSLTPVPARDPLHPCLPDENEKRYRYPGSCSIFFQCLHGRAITMACDSSLVFDVTLNVCQVTTPDCHETSATTQDSGEAFFWNVLWMEGYSVAFSLPRRPPPPPCCCL